MPLCSKVCCVCLVSARVCACLSVCVRVGVVDESKRARFMELLRKDVTHTLTIAQAERKARIEGLMSTMEREITVCERTHTKAEALASGQGKRKFKPKAKAKDEEADKSKEEEEREKANEAKRAARQEMYAQAKKELKEWITHTTTTTAVAVDAVISLALALFKELRDNARLPTEERAWREQGFHSAAEALVLITREMADYAGSLF